MKDILIEIKNNLQGNSSSVNDTKIQINDMEYRGKNTTNQNKKKKELKKSRIVLGASGTASSIPTFAS